jgi:hypothetical protein
METIGDMPVLFLLVSRFVRLLFSGHQAVVIENAALRNKDGGISTKRKYALLTTWDRVFWIALRSVLVQLAASSGLCPGRRRRPLASRTVPEFLGTAFKQQRRRRGQPGAPAELRRLIKQMAAANPLWRAPRIHCELKMLRIEISERTVSRIRRTLRRPPKRPWRTFLHNHVYQMVSIEFFTVPTITMRVLFVLIVMEHGRTVLHFNVTEHPTGNWTAQQIVEAFADREAAQYLIRDRDSTWSPKVQLRIRSLDIQEILTAPQSPWQNPYAERLIGSLHHPKRSPSQENLVFLLPLLPPMESPLESRQTMSVASRGVEEQKDCRNSTTRRPSSPI